MSKWPYRQKVTQQSDSVIRSDHLQAGVVKAGLARTRDGFLSTTATPHYSWALHAIYLSNRYLMAYGVPNKGALNTVEEGSICLTVWSNPEIAQIKLLNKAIHCLEMFENIARFKNISFK